MTRNFYNGFYSAYYSSTLNLALFKTEKKVVNFMHELYSFIFFCVATDRVYYIPELKGSTIPSRRSKTRFSMAGQLGQNCNSYLTTF